MKFLSFIIISLFQSTAGHRPSTGHKPLEIFATEILLLLASAHSHKLVKINPIFTIKLDHPTRGKLSTPIVRNQFLVVSEILFTSHLTKS